MHHHKAYAQRPTDTYCTQSMAWDDLSVRATRWRQRNSQLLCLAQTCIRPTLTQPTNTWTDDEAPHLLPANQSIRAPQHDCCAVRCGWHSPETLSVSCHISRHSPTFCAPLDAQTLLPGAPAHSSEQAHQTTLSQQAALGHYCCKDCHPPALNLSQGEC